MFHRGAAASKASQGGESGYNAPSILPAALTALLGVLFAAALVMGGFAPEVTTVNSSAIPADRPSIAETMPQGGSLPGCVASAEWPEGEIPAAAEVVRLDGTVQRMGLGEVESRAGGSKADDVWVIGACG